MSKSLIWSLFCVLMLFASVFTGVLTSITDSLVMKVAETNNSNFGQMRVWGTIGWGLVSYAVGHLNKLENKYVPLYTPGILLFVVLQLIDLVLMLSHLKRLREACKNSELKRERRLTLQETIEQSINQSMNQHANQANSEFSIRSANHSIEQSNASKEQLSRKADEEKSNHVHKKQIMKFVFLTCRAHPMLIKYIFICVIVGLCTALNWNYLPLFLGELQAKDTNLVGLTSFVQCFGSEMPFMYFSGKCV